MKIIRIKKAAKVLRDDGWSQTVVWFRVLGNYEKRRLSV